MSFTEAYQAGKSIAINKACFPSPIYGLHSLIDEITIEASQNMYFADLTVYQNILGSKNLRHVGWLDIKHDFAQGLTSERVIHVLEELLLSKRDVNKMRGFHVCEFCARDQFGEKYVPKSREEFRNYMEKTTIYLGHEGKRKLLGMSEIWIPSTSGIIYAAPSLIYHYIATHNYLPPKEFLEAVELFDLKSEWNGEAEVEKWLIHRV